MAHGETATGFRLGLRKSVVQALAPGRRRRLLVSSGEEAPHLRVVAMVGSEEESRLRVVQVPDQWAGKIILKFNLRVPIL